MEDDAEDKTEAPSQRRRDEAREQGQIAFSPDLNAGLLLLTGVILVWLYGGELSGNLHRVMVRYFHNYLPQSVDARPLGALKILSSSALMIVQTAGMFWGLMFAAGLGVSLAQSGVYFSAGALEPKWNKLNPFEGIGRIVSMQGAVKGLGAMLKVILIGAIVGYMLWGREKQIASLSEGSLAHSVGVAWGIVIRLMLAIAAVLLLIGVADYAWQRYRFEKSLMQSRQQMREEHKTEEGDPHIKSRRRAIARQLATKQRIAQEVPKATVVVTNPTHLAVALRYEREDMDAPLVVAKGRGFLAGLDRNFAQAGR